MHPYTDVGRSAPWSDTEPSLGVGPVDRRTILKGTAVVGVGALAAVFSSGRTASKPAGLATGTLVVDGEAASPDVAVVLATPGVPVDDWHVWPGETVADTNPAYDPAEPVVIVAYVGTLARKWPDWFLTPADRLFGEVCARGIKFYAFPASRLTST